MTSKLAPMLPTLTDSTRVSMDVRMAITIVSAAVLIGIWWWSTSTKLDQLQASVAALRSDASKWTVQDQAMFVLLANTSGKFSKLPSPDEVRAVAQGQAAALSALPVPVPGPGDAAAMAGVDRGS